MATVDNLSLQITASSKDAVTKIDDLIGSLKRLNTAFTSLTGSTTYASNLETAVHSITRVSNAIKNINAAQVKEVASALKSLSSSSKSLSEVGSNVSFARVSDKAKEEADTIAKAFGITGKKGVKELETSITNLQNVLGDSAKTSEAVSQIETIIKKYAQLDTTVGETYRKIREYISNTKLYLPEGLISELGDDFKSQRAKIGISNTTTDITKGTDIQFALSEMSDALGDVVEVSNTAQGCFRNLFDYLSNSSNAMATFNDGMINGRSAVELLEQSLQSLLANLGQVELSYEQLDAAYSKVDYSQFDNDADFFAAMGQEAINAADKVNAMNNALSQTQQTAQPFEQIVAGFESLQGVTIGDFSNITTLAEGVNKLGYQSAINASQVLPSIADGLRQFEDFTLPDMGDMDSFSRGLRSLGSKAAQNAASALPFIADGLKQLKNVGDLPSMNGLNEFAQSLSVFGRQTSERAVQTIPQLTQAFQRLFDTMSRAPRISQNTIDAANAMANLASRTGGVTRALNGANPALRTWSSNAGRAAKSSFSLASAIGKVYATYWMLFRAFGMIGKSINIASDLTEVKNVVVQAFGDMSYKANEFARTAGEAFGMSKLQALDAASRYQAMGKTMGITDNAVAKSNDFLRDKLSDTLALKEVQQAYGDLGNTAADMSINLTRLAGDLASLYNVDIEVAAEKLNSIFTGTTKPLREFGFDLTQATLQEWAMKNGIDANVKSMTQAEKAVLRYQYVMANASFVMGDFVRTADSWHNTIVRMKLAFQNLGSVIGQGFINLLKPAIQKVTAFVNTLTKLVEKALNAIGKLLGWQVQIDPVKPTGDLSGGGNGNDEDKNSGGGSGGGSDASKAAEDTAKATEDADDASKDYADNMEKAQKAAKKMKDYLLGIDELNVFKPDDAEDAADKAKKDKDKAKKDKDSGDGSGGSGSGSAGGSDGGATGGDVKTTKYDSEIKSWFQLGDRIGDALSKAMEGIDWDKIYKKAEKFGTGLASFLNGLITPRLFENVGKTIANSLNTALHFLDSFGKHFDWKNFGASIAAGINGFFKNFDFKLLASVLNTWALGLLDTLIVALRKTDWEMIGKKIGEFLVNIKWLAIGKKIAQAIWEAINAAFKVYKGMLKTAPLETAILSVVGAFKLFYDLKTAAWFKNLTKVVGAFTTELNAGNGVIAATNAAFPVLGSLLTRIVQIYSIGATSVGAFAKSMSMGQGFVNASILGFATLRDGVNAFAASLSPIAKLVGGVFAAFVEFFTVSDGIKNIMTGMQSLKASIAEIAVGVGVAGTAFSLVFGFPAGLIATAVVGVVAAIKGVNDAIKEIQIEDFGNKVKNALINPGGTPLEDVIGDTIDSLNKMGDEFETLAADSEKLNSVDDNIKDIQTEIDLLERQLANGVITQEEYTQQVADAYSRMSAAIQTKIGEAELYVSAALGEGGAISEALKQQGVDVNKVVDDTILSGDQLLQRATDITQQLASLDPKSPEYANLKQELYNLATQADDTDKASQALATSLQKPLDWEKFINKKGALETETLKGILGEVANKADDVKTSAEDSMNGVVTALKNAGNEAGADEVQNAIPGALENINGQISEKCIAMSDTIQKDAIDNITDIINQAGDTWEGLVDWEKAIYDYNKSEYQKRAAESYKTSVIDPLSQTIEEEYGQLGIDGAGWAEDASSEIMKGIFSESVVGNEEGWQTYITSLSTNWQDAVKQGSELTYDTAVENGEYVAQGIGEGMKEADTDTPISDFFRKLWDSFANKFQSHSPAKAMYPMGENIMAGVIEGFKQKYNDISKAISDWFEKCVKPWFTVEKWKILGTNMATALITKWNEMVIQWTTDVGNWWNSVVQLLDLAKWKAEADHIRDAIITKLGDMISEWNSKVDEWWKSVVELFDLKKWKEQANHIKEAIIGAIDDTIKEWGSKIDELVKDFGARFKASDFKKIGEDAMNALWDGLKTVADKIKSWWNELKSWFTSNPIKPKVEQADTSGSQSENGGNNDKGKSKKTTKASGGVFDDGRWRNVHAYGMGSTDIDNGQLFWAREKGPELVGTIGGNTAVVNNDQIVASVAAGVQQAVTEALAPYLSDISTNTKVTASKDFTVQIGDRQIAEANNRGQRAIGAVLFT